MQNLESALTPCHMAYVFHLFRLTGGFQDNSVFKSAGRSFAPEEDHWAILSPSQGLHWWVTVEKAPAVRFDPGSAHPGERQERIELTPGERTWTKELNHLNHSRFAVIHAVCLIGGVRVRGLGIRLPRLSWLQDGVWRLLPMLYLCAALAACSLSCFFFFHLTLLSLSLCLYPSLSQHPPIPLLHSRSPPLRHPGCFCACCHLKSCLSVPRLTKLPALLYFSPDTSVLFEVSLLSVLLGRVQVFGWRTRHACSAYYHSKHTQCVSVWYISPNCDGSLSPRKQAKVRSLAIWWPEAIVGSAVLQSEWNENSLIFDLIMFWPKCQWHMPDFSIHFVPLTHNQQAHIIWESNRHIPKSNQQKVDWTKSPSYIFYILNNPLHLGVHCNVEERICHYFCFTKTFWVFFEALTRN